MEKLTFYYMKEGEIKMVRLRKEAVMELNKYKKNMIEQIDRIKIQNS